MHEKSPTLNAVKREKVGTRYNNRLREQGHLPAVMYGHGEAPLAIAVDHREASRRIHKGEKIFNIALGGDKPQTVLLKEVQFDHLGTRLVHADFARVSLTDRVRTRVPVHLVGEAKGLKQAGTLLMHPTNEIVIECKVVDIPDSIEVNVSEVDLGEVITAGQVKLPTADMKLITDTHAIVAQVAMAGVLKTAEEETVAAAGAAEPEVITAKKPAEGEAAKGAAAPAKGAAPAAKGAAPAKPAAGGDAKKK